LKRREHAREETVTTKERVIRAIEGLPADATLDQIVGTLQHMRLDGGGEQQVESGVVLPAGGLWDFLEQSAGTVEMPADWSSEHDHYLYGTASGPPRHEISHTMPE
jgi:hypothetical protein